MARVHCWEHYEDAEGRSYTCLRWEGHKGPHRWTADSDITINFVGASDED